MTDVMVLALMIFYMNSSGYIEAKVLPGVYCFAASALMTMIAYGWANSADAPSDTTQADLGNVLSLAEKTGPRDRKTGRGEALPAP
jgi:paraquat-inducible protein A